MSEILRKYIQDDSQGEPIDWHETIDEDGQSVITNGQQAIPVVGTLTEKTTPADFERFARQAAVFYARRKMMEERRGQTFV